MLWEKLQLSTRLQAIIIKKTDTEGYRSGKLTGRKTFEQNNRNDGICWWTPETNRSGKVHRE